MSRPTFLGIDIARTGLFMAQRQLDVTGHNIVNADTVGYTRQRLVQESIEPGMNPWFIKQMDLGNQGMGVRSTILEQIRDQFLDKQYRAQNSTASNWSMRARQLNQLQNIFPEKMEIGITDSMQKFYDALQELSKNPVDYEIRTVVKSTAETMCFQFQLYNQQLVDMQQAENEAIEQLVKQVNDIAQNIAMYNKVIAATETAAEPANDLRDKRNLLLDQLSSLVDFTYKYNEQGLLSVYIGDKALVSHKEVSELAVEAVATPDPATGATGLYNVIWKDADPAANDVIIKGGELRARLDMRDGSTSTNSGIPYFASQLNQLAQSLVQEINAIHYKAYTQAHDGIASTDQIYFFDPACVTAGTIRVNPEVVNDVWLIAAADAPTTGDPDVDNADSNANRNKAALAMTALFNSTTLPGIGSFEGFLRSLVVDIASQVKHAENNAEAEGAAAENLDSLRLSVSSVWMDEELSNMLKFENSYNAASRILTAMDEALDKLINGTGIVGR